MGSHPPWPAELEAGLPRAFQLEDNDMGPPPGYEPEKRSYGPGRTRRKGER